MIMIRQILDRISNLAKLNADYSAIQGQAARDACIRIWSAMWFLVPMHLITAVVISRSAPLTADDPLKLTWSYDIALLHSIAGIVVLIIGSVAKIIIRQPPSHTKDLQAVVIQIGTSTLYLLLGVAFTTVDFKSGMEGGVTSYALIAVIIGGLSLLRPSIIIPLIISSSILFWGIAVNAARVVGADVGVINVSSISSCLLAVFLSMLMWHTYALKEQYKLKLKSSNIQLEIQRAELEILAERDELTGLFNRRKFTFLSKMELARAARFPTDTSVLMVDIDFFKSINDKFGHPGGDQILKQIAAVLTNCVRETDVVGRLGGEEFIILLPNTATGGSLVVAEKVRNAVEAFEFKVNDTTTNITVSVGSCSQSSKTRVTVDQLYDTADKALYIAKHNGRNRVQFQTID